MPPRSRTTCAPARGSTASPTIRVSKSRRWTARRANRRARFRTVISLLVGDEEHLFEGVVEGRIVERESGAEGFGYDPLFVPDGCDRTFAEMSPDEKNAVSHRGRAVRKLAAFLRARGEK